MSTATDTAYFLLGIVVPTSEHPPSKFVEKAIENINADGDVELVALPFGGSDGIEKQDHVRLIYRIGSGSYSAAHAELLAECIVLAVEYIRGPVYESDLGIYCVPFAAPDFSQLTTIENERIESAYRELHPELGEYGIVSDLYTEVTVPSFQLGPGLEVGVALLREADLRLALAFLANAQRSFYVWPGGLRDALADGEWMPRTISDQVSWETSFLNTYRAIEAVVGDPPKSEDRFRSALICVGIDPDCIVGYLAKQPVLDVLREMNQIRDKKVAHGSTKTRGIKLSQMVEFQECARFVVSCAMVQRGILKDQGAT